jgi:hypothetical protein
MRYSTVTLGRRFWTKPEADKLSGFGELRRSHKYFEAGDHWLARMVGGADILLRRCHGVHEFTSKRACIFRIAVRNANRPMSLNCGRSIRPGDAVVELHLWNEHVLRIPSAGPDLAWAKHMRRRFRDSLVDLAMHLDEEPALRGAAAVCACGGIAYEGNGGKVARFMEKFGFEAFPCPSHGRLIDFFCDFWSLLLVIGFNPRSARTDLLFGRRYELWMSREVLSQRFGRSVEQN